MTDERKLSFIDERLCFALYSTSKAVISLYKPYLTKMDITYPQYLILIVLIEIGEMSVNQIGDHLYLDSGTLTPLLKRMEASGLVTRQRSKSDERIVLVNLTQKSIAMKSEIAEMQFEVSCSVGLDKTSFQRLRDELKSLNSRLRSD